MVQLKKRECILMDVKYSSILSRLALCSLLLLSSYLWAQIPNDFGYHDYKERFPKESFVFLDINIEDVFDIKNGSLEIYSDSEEQLLCLNYNAIGLKNRSIGYDQFSELENIEAYCYYPSNGKYKKEKVKEFVDEAVISNGISFYDDSKEKKFQYENFGEGMVTFQKYRRVIKDPHLLFTRSFSSGLFIKKEVYTIKVHQDVEIGFHEFHIDREKIKYKSWKEGDYVYHSWISQDAEKSVIYGDEYYDLYYEPHVIPYVKSYKIDGKTTNVFRNLDDLYAWYYSLLEQVQAPKEGSLKQLADSITAGADSELEKVKKVYYWVQDRIKYIAFGDGYGGFVPRDPDLIYERRYGDCKDMTCLTVNLLDQLDIKAYFTWVGTRKIPYSYSEVADPSVDNHMIATYIADNEKKYFLDATNPNLEFGRPSSFIQGKEVLISKGKTEYELDSVPILNPKENSEVDSTFLRIEEKKVVGNGKFIFTGYLAEDFFRTVKDIPKDELIKHFNSSLTKGSNKFSSSNVDFFRPSDSKDSLQINYDFEIDSYVNSIGDNLYLNLNLTKQLKDFEFDKKQNVPIVLDYKNYLEKVFYLEIPDNYMVEYLPEDFELENKFLKVSIQYAKEKESIKYNLKFEQKIIFLTVDDVPKWNEVIKKLSQNLDESIKFKKIDNE